MKLLLSFLFLTIALNLLSQVDSLEINYMKFEKVVSNRPWKLDSLDSITNAGLTFTENTLTIYGGYDSKPFVSRNKTILIYTNGIYLIQFLDNRLSFIKPYWYLKIDDCQVYIHFSSKMYYLKEEKIKPEQWYRLK